MSCRGSEEKPVPQELIDKIVAEAKKLFCPKLNTKCFGDKCVCFKFETERKTEQTRKTTGTYTKGRLWWASPHSKGVCTYKVKRYMHAECTLFNNKISPTKTFVAKTFTENFDTGAYVGYF